MQLEIQAPHLKERLIKRFCVGARKMALSSSPVTVNLCLLILGAHLAQGRHIPGILTLNEELSVGEIVEELLLIAGASLVDEYQDRIEYLPVP